MPERFTILLHTTESQDSHSFLAPILLIILEGEVIAMGVDLLHRKQAKNRKITN